VGEYHQQHLAILSPVTAGMDPTTQPTLDHAEHGFDLPALAVLLPGKTSLHQAAVFPGRLFPGGPSAFGRDDTFDLILIPSALVVGFAVISGIGQNRPEGNLPDDGLKEFSELVDIDAGPPGRQGPEDQMISAIPDDGQFGEPGILRRLPQIRHSGASADKVSADMTGLQAGGINGCQRDFFLLQNGLYRLEPQPIGHRKPPQFGAGFLEGCKVRNLSEMDPPGQIRTILQKGCNPSVIQFQKRFQNQTGKQLRQREFPGTEPMGVGRQDVLGGRIGHDQHLLWRFGSCAHSRLYTRINTRAQVRNKGN